MATPTRGVSLVERAIADRVAKRPKNKAKPKGLSAAKIAALAMPDGRPLPPSLARYLAYDADGLLVLEGTPPRLAFRGFADMVRAQYGDELVDAMAGFAKLLPAPCLAVPGGADSRRFLYAGEPDAHGEYPVFVMDIDDQPWVGLAYPGLDVYLADGHGVDVVRGSYSAGFEHPVYARDMADQARRNFHGLIGTGLDDDALHLDGRAAGVAVVAKLLGAPARRKRRNPFTGVISED